LTKIQDLRVDGILDQLPESVTLFGRGNGIFLEPFAISKEEEIVARFHGKAGRVEEMRPGTLVQFLYDTDAIRQPERFKEFLRACESDSRGRTGFENKPYTYAALWLKMLRAAMGVDAGAVAKRFDEPEKIKQAVFEARVEAVKRVVGG